MRDRDEGFQLGTQCAGCGYRNGGLGVTTEIYVHLDLLLQPLYPLVFLVYLASPSVRLLIRLRYLYFFLPFFLSFFHSFFLFLLSLFLCFFLIIYLSLLVLFLTRLFFKVFVFCFIPSSLYPLF